MPDEVLLVADDFEFALQVRLSLEKSGLKVLLVETGRQVIALATLLLPAAIVLDGDMPGAEGTHICQALKDRPVTQGIPLVVLGNRPGGLLDIPADAFVPKDWALEGSLRRMLERLGVLGGYQQEDPLLAGPESAEMGSQRWKATDSGAGSMMD